MIEGHSEREAPEPGPSAHEILVRRAAEAAVALVFEVDMDALRVATRGPAEAAFARQIAMYLAHVVCGLSLTQVGRAFGRDRTTVAHACSLIEDRRDEAEFDCTLTHLESAVAALLDATTPRRRVA
ncbi:DNA replication initiation protein [Methyloligella sp. GL2]|nr:DNA replication initiation protein [Methyloligella sp. GL2]